MDTNGISSLSSKYYIYDSAVLPLFSHCKSVRTLTHRFVQRAYPKLLSWHHPAHCNYSTISKTTNIGWHSQLFPLFLSALQHGNEFIWTFQLRMGVHYWWSNLFISLVMCCQTIWSIIRLQHVCITSSFMVNDRSTIPILFPSLYGLLSRRLLFLLSLFRSIQFTLQNNHDNLLHLLLQYDILISYCNK